jgi:hypothetical protein
MRVALKNAIGTAILLTCVTPAFADCVGDYMAKAKASRLSADAARAMLQDPDFKRCNSLPSLSSGPKITGLNNPAPPNPSAPRVASKKEEPYPIPPAYVTNIYPLLRHDFNDVWLFDKRQGVSDIPDAQGATLSYASDAVAKNEIWNVDAVGAVVFQYLHDRYPKGDGVNFIGLSVAPFAGIDRVTNSNPKAQINNVDQSKFGGSGEIGFDALGGAQYFRTQGAIIDDRIARTNNGSAVFEWIPVYDNFLNSPIYPASVPLYFVFGPEIKVRYDDVIINDATGAKANMWRVGPQVVMRYGFVGVALPADLVFLERLHGQTTVSWLTDSGNGLNYSYLDTSLTFNVDSAGHIGLTGEYTKGRFEDTGRKVDLWKAGLTAKW